MTTSHHHQNRTSRVRGAARVPVLGVLDARQPAPMLARRALCSGLLVRPNAFGNALGESLAASAAPQADDPQFSLAGKGAKFGDGGSRVKLGTGNDGASIAYTGAQQAFVDALTGYMSEGSSEHGPGIVVADAGIPGTPDAASKVRALERLRSMGFSGSVSSDGQLSANDSVGLQQQASNDLTARALRDEAQEFIEGSGIRFANDRNRQGLLNRFTADAVALDAMQGNGSDQTPWLLQRNPVLSFSGDVARDFFVDVGRTSPVLGGLGQAVTYGLLGGETNLDAGLAAVPLLGRFARGASALERTTIRLGDDAAASRLGVEASEIGINASRPSLGAIEAGYGSLSRRQTSLLDGLSDSGSSLTIHRSEASVRDLGALTAATGDEFGMFRRGSQTLLVRGNGEGLQLTESQLRGLADDGYRLSGHSHPRVNGPGDLLSIGSSGGDRDAIGIIFKQQRSVIIDSGGNRNVFTPRPGEDTLIPPRH